MVNDYAASIQAVALRATKLGPDGAPLVGPKSSYVTKAFTQVSFTPEYDEGEEVSTKNAAGEICIHYKMPDTLKQVAIELAICDPNPELYEILNGGTVILGTGEDADRPIGYIAPEKGVDPTPNGVSIEVWSRAIVNSKPAATLPYWQWVFPWAKVRMSGDRALENGAMAHTFSGYGNGNDDWDGGPDAGWTFPSGSPFQYARVATAPTAVGYVPVT